MLQRYPPLLLTLVDGPCLRANSLSTSLLALRIANSTPDSVVSNFYSAGLDESCQEPPRSEWLRQYSGNYGIGGKL